MEELVSIVDFSNDAKDFSHKAAMELEEAARYARKGLTNVTRFHIERAERFNSMAHDIRQYAFGRA